MGLIYKTSGIQRPSVGPLCGWKKAAKEMRLTISEGNTHRVEHDNALDQ